MIHNHLALCITYTRLFQPVCCGYILSKLEAFAFVFTRRSSQREMSTTLSFCRSFVPDSLYTNAVHALQHLHENNVKN